MLLHEQYQEQLNQEKTLLWEIHACLLKTGADQGDLAKIKDAVEGLDELFLLVIVGEFNSGKSAFVNTLLGQKVLEEGPTPTTDLINILKHGDEPGSRVLDNLRVTRFPLELLKTVNIVDTPGTNSILKEHDELTLNFIPKADFVIFVISADRPLSDSEREFLEIISIKWKRKVLFLLNKIDTKSAKDVEIILEYLRREAAKILGIEPQIFPVSVRQAFEALAANDRKFLETSRFEALEQYLDEALNESERIRLKLQNPANIVLPICLLEQKELRQKLDVVAEDRRKLQQIDKQLAYTRDDLKENYSRFLLRVENILLDLRNRAYDFVDDFLQLRNIWDITSKEKAQQQFHEQVVKDSSEQIEDVLTEAADWLVKKSMRIWDDTLETYKQQLNPNIYRGKVIGEIGGQFVYDRDKIYQGVIRDARSKIKEFNYQQESQNILKTFQNALIHFAAAEVGALGIGTILISMLSGLFLDITGFVAATTIATAGLFILPRKRKQAKEQFNGRIQALIAELKGNVGREFDDYMENTLTQIKETISPVDRFCRAEQEELEQGQQELVTLLARLEEFQRSIHMK